MNSTSELKAFGIWDDNYVVVARPMGTRPVFKGPRWCNGFDALMMVQAVSPEEAVRLFREIEETYWASPSSFRVSQGHAVERACI